MIQLPVLDSLAPVSARDVTTLFFALFGIWVIYQVLRALYNLSPLHPLYRIPGPRLAAATYLPEFYYDFVEYGRYTNKIKHMHEAYGDISPIVRINPDEVHCNDPSFFDEIYAVGGRKRNKPQHLVNGSAHSESGFGTIDHDLHRRRRGPVARFFSRGMISRLESDIHDLAQLLCHKLLSSGKEPIDITAAYSCFTSDAISSYCFGESFGFLAQKGWFPNFRAAEAAVLKPVFAFRFFPILRHLAGVGEWLIDYLPDDMALLIRTLKIDIPSRIQKTQADIDAGIVRDRPTVFGSLLQLKPEEKEVLSIADEAAALIGAGTETTSWTLAVITYHLLSNPEQLTRLRQELEKVVEDPQHLPNLTTLETLPYLQGVIQEGLRLSYGVSARSSRVPTEESLVYHGEWHKKPIEYVIPKGYAIGTSSVTAHHDENVFPNSHAFLPERWLDEKHRKTLERSLFAFSRGSRSCLGMNLAICELNVAISSLALRVFPRMHLFETTEADVRYDHDMFVPVPKADSKGVRVKIASV